MGNMRTLSQGGQGQFGIAPAPSYVQPQTKPLAEAYPPAPRIRPQSKPTEINMTDFKYNAVNVDSLNLNITSRQGFDGATPDMLIWNFYQYNVTNLQANANETELSSLLDFNLKEKGISDVNVDFHNGNRVTLSGKYPLMGIPIPFSADVKLTTTSNDKLMLTIEQFKTGFRIPDQLKDTLIGLLVSDGSETHNGMVPTNPADAFSISDAMYRIGSNQIIIDFSRMKVPLNLPIKEIRTSETGFSVVGGVSMTQHPQITQDQEAKTVDRLSSVRQGGLPSLSQIRKDSVAVPQAPVQRPQPSGNNSSNHPQVTFE